MLETCSGGSAETTSAADGFEPTSLAANLVQARETGRPVAILPELVPPDLESARAVQRKVIALRGGQIAGWKIASTPHGFASAPLLAEGVIVSGNTWPSSRGQVIGVELEIAVRLKADVRSSEVSGLDWHSFSACLDKPLLGIELIGGRYRPNDPVPFPAFLADNLANAGYVIGSEAEGDVASALGRTHCSVEIDGKPVFAGTAAHPNGGPFDLLRSCLGEMGETVPILRAGHILTTGSICGLVPVHHPRHVRATLAGFGTVECRFAEHR